MPNYSGGVAVCPFYQRESGRSIICEGYSPEQQVSMKFNSSKEKLRWQQEYCLRFYYPRCPLAATVLAHYRQKDEAEGLERCGKGA